MPGSIELYWKTCGVITCKKKRQRRSLFAGVLEPLPADFEISGLQLELVVSLKIVLTLGISPYFPISVVIHENGLIIFVLNPNKTFDL